MATIRADERAITTAIIKYLGEQRDPKAAAVAYHMATRASPEQASTFIDAIEKGDTSRATDILRQTTSSDEVEAFGLADPLIKAIKTMRRSQKDRKS